MKTTAKPKSDNRVKFGMYWPSPAHAATIAAAAESHGYSSITDYVRQTMLAVAEARLREINSPVPHLAKGKSCASKP